MKIVTASNGKRILKISRTEWEKIGRQAGWLPQFPSLSKEQAAETMGAVHSIDSALKTLKANEHGITDAAKKVIMENLRSGLSFVTQFSKSVAQHPHAEMPNNNLVNNIEALMQAVSKKDVKAAKSSASQVQKDLMTVAAYVQHLQNVL